MDENFPLKASSAQSQIYLNETALDNIEDFFQIVSIQNKDLKDLPLRETFYLIAHDEAGKREMDNTNRDIYVLNLHVIPNQEVLDLNDEEEQEAEEEEEEE